DGGPPGARAGDRALGELLQRGGVRGAHRSAVEALHLAPAAAARLHPVRVLPPDVPLRIAVGPPGLRSARRLARPPAPQPTRRALLLLPRSLLRRTLRDRGPQARQLLAGLLPRSAARESRRRAGRRRGSRLGEAPRRVARRALSGRVACDAARAGRPAALAHSPRRGAGHARARA